jgi:uncharacterized protein YbaR (Trm112 family)
MPQSKKSTPKVEEVRPYLEGVAKNLVDKLYGPHGPAWGTKLTDIEDLILALRQIRSEEMIDETLARQATAHDQQPAALHCPNCRQPLACDDTNERIVQTRVGEAQWAEPQAYCNRCRRAFFPSVQEPGHRSG